MSAEIRGDGMLCRICHKPCEPLPETTGFVNRRLTPAQDWIAYDSTNIVHRSCRDAAEAHARKSK